LVFETIIESFHSEQYSSKILRAACKCKKLVDKAQKALYALYRKIYNLAIPVDLQLKPFDSLVTPILL
jgi:hypothetical protein